MALYTSQPLDPRTRTVLRKSIRDGLGSGQLPVDGNPHPLQTKLDELMKKYDGLEKSLERVQKKIEASLSTMEETPKRNRLSSVMTVFMISEVSMTSVGLYCMYGKSIIFGISPNWTSLATPYLQDLYCN
jgi:hypothetical protein